MHKATHTRHVRELAIKLESPVSVFQVSQGTEKPLASRTSPLLVQKNAKDRLTAVDCEGCIVINDEGSHFFAAMIFFKIRGEIT